MPSSTSKNFICFHFSEVPMEERILHFWYYLSVLSCVRLIFTLFVLWCHMSKSYRFRLQECGSHRRSGLQMSVSWVAVWIMAEIYWESVQYSSSVFSIKMDYVMYWSETLWHWKKITEVFATSYPLLESCSWSRCIGLRIYEMFCLLFCTRYLNEIHRGPVSLSWMKMGPITKLM